MIVDMCPNVIIHHVYELIGYTFYRALLELLGLPIIGSSAEKHYIATSKASTRALLTSACASVAPGIELYYEQDKSFLEKLDAMDYPVVVKAASVEDSGGVFLVKSRDDVVDKVHQAFQMSNSVVVIEKFIAGRELRCFVIEDGNCEKVFLPVLEYNVNKHDIRHYDEQYTVDNVGNITQAKRPRLFVDPIKERERENQVLKITIIRSIQCLTVA